MAAMTVFTIPGSPFGRAVQAALEEKGAAYRVVKVPAAEFRSEAHLARHPFGKVPVLDDDGFRLYETQAILRYIDRTFPSPELTPAEKRAVARMDQLLNIADWYLFKGVLDVIGFQRIVGPRIMGIPTDEAAIAACMGQARQVFRVLADFLGDQPYFGGASISLADLVVGAMTGFIAPTPEWPVLTGPHPHLVAWRDRMEARPSFAATTWERVAATC